MAKVVKYFELSKKNALLLAFFSLEDAAGRYRLEVIGQDLPEWDSGVKDKENYEYPTSRGNRRIFRRSAPMRLGLMNKEA